MDEIKSAWEIAREKIKDIAVDKESLAEHESVLAGKKIISRFLDDPERTSPGNELKSLSGKQKTQVKRGMLETLLANLTLPLSDGARLRNERVAGGLKLLAPSSKPLAGLLGQIADFFKAYEEEREHLEESLEAQYAPRLRQKAEALAKQLGARVELKAVQDPEYLALLRKNLSAFDERYQSALAEVKKEIERLVDQAP